MNGAGSTNSGGGGPAWAGMETSGAASSTAVSSGDTSDGSVVMGWFTTLRDRGAELSARVGNASMAEKWLCAGRQAAAPGGHRRAPNGAANYSRSVSGACRRSIVDPTPTGTRDDVIFEPTTMTRN